MDVNVNEERAVVQNSTKFWREQVLQKFPPVSLELTSRLLGSACIVMLTRLEIINGGGVADSFLLFLAGVGFNAFTAGVRLEGGKV